jgi:dTDP-glucose 4,6-dehydratase
VEDLVGGILAMVDSDEPGPINLGNDDERTVRAIAEAVRAVVGASSPIVSVDALPDDPMQRRPDLRLARERLRWAPSTPLDVGLRAALPWFAARADRRLDGAGLGELHP